MPQNQNQDESTIHPEHPEQQAVEPRRRVVIAGGSGFIGRRLSAVLGSSGFDVVILSRQAPRAPVGPIQFAHWDPEQSAADESLESLIEGAHAVVNLCGESIGGPRWNESRKALLIDSRVLPTRSLIAAINQVQAPPELLVQASGVGFYGIGNEPLTESSARGDDFLADLAAQWEAPLTELRTDVRAVIARLGVVLGRSGGALTQMLMPFRLFVGGPIASGNQWLSWIHLHDAAAAITALIEDSTSQGIYNLTAPEPVRNAEFAVAAGKALGRPAWMFTPRVVLKALLGEQSTLICDGQQAFPERLQQAGFTFSHPDIERALGDLTQSL